MEENGKMKAETGRSHMFTGESYVNGGKSLSNMLDGVVCHHIYTLSFEI
jgi:hypothetical protein